VTLRKEGIKVTKSAGELDKTLLLSLSVLRAFVNLKDLECEVSHNLWIPIKDRLEGFDSYDSIQSSILGDNCESLLNIEREGELNMIVTISGTAANVMDSKASPEEDLQDRFALSNTFSNIGDVGHLQVKVFRAEGIRPEYVWKRKPVTVLQLGNCRVQTRTRKTLEPEWNEIFKFDVKDVYEVLEVTVYDDNGDEDYEFLGKIQLPLLCIENEKERWYKLKDQSLRKSAKGEAPRILLELKFSFNSIRASSGIFKPKTIRYEEKCITNFEFAKFKQNARRMSKVKEKFRTQKQKIINIFEWRDPFISFCALIMISAAIWNFENWMLPVSLVLLLTVQIIHSQPLQNKTTSLNSLTSVEEEDISEEVPGDQVDGSLTMMETLDKLLQRALWMQEGMGQLANIVESVENVFNFTVPFISWFIYLFFMALTILLYFVPARMLVLAWVLNKFRKGFLRKPSTSNKLVNFLSRVPDNEELANYQELDGSGDAGSKSLFRLRRRATRDSNII